PTALVTCWIALSHGDAGPLEIVPGSHHWGLGDKIRFLHAPPEDYRAPLWQAGAIAGIARPDIVPITIPDGSAVFLHGNLWHGSRPNVSHTATRHSLSISSLSGQTQFQPDPKGYIFDRYRMRGRLALDESYYPILWSADGYRTPFLQDYCQTHDHNPPTG
ncbi:MAG: phytanoyl-CoA dioxygenase family protein, partial [Cyanobacteria bacterium P01_A01_bin.105]